jgi:hypothetical protein
MVPSFRVTVRYAATWRVLAELLRRHQDEHDLALYWYFPGLSHHGVVELRRRHELVLTLDVAHGQALGDGAGEDVADARDYVAALLAADDPKRVVDALERAAHLPPRVTAPPASNALTLCARVIAGVLERRVLARAPVRTTPGYIDHDGALRAAGWIACLPELQVRLAAARAARADAGGELDESALVQHVFALHVGDGPLDAAVDRHPPFVVFDLRAGVAHAIHGPSRRSSLALREHLDRAGGRLERLVDWAEVMLT